MPAYLLDGPTWQMIWPIFLAPLVVAALFSSLFAGGEPQHKVAGLFQTRIPRIVFLIALAFAALGSVTGFITGLAREPAVNAVMPAVLSLVGGLVIYLIGKTEESRVIVCVALLCLTATLFLGAVWGAKHRQSIEFYMESAEYLKYRAYVDTIVDMYKTQYEIQAEEWKDWLREAEQSPQ